ncbi:hypothetical protein BGX29_009677 [Mortierella sp. GBA35]|nr:hypothetical protein BGX29_009677 [Mortierella sp. GBA35]
MVKTFHGRVDETVDALIIFEACRQGIMPRLNRRLFAAERGETMLPDPSDESTSATAPSSRPSTRPSSTRSHPSTATPSSSSSSSSASSSSRFTAASSTSASKPAASNSSAHSASTSLSRPASTPNPSLIVPGSVFVFDENESGICRWTDGRIWSPSRICGNFLVYRELYRKLPDQKCYTQSDKMSMKDGSGLKDKALKEKVDKENLVVVGCMKGTFVLKKDGLVKKTICVKGINLLPPEELKKLEAPVRTGRGMAGASGDQQMRGLPGFSMRGVQHLVCYEKPGEMDSLHGPREYLELRDLPLSKTFITMQMYRNPLRILPLQSGQVPSDPADEYIHSSRVIEMRTAKQTTSASTKTKRGSAAKRRRLRGKQKKVNYESDDDDEFSRWESDYDIDASEATRSRSASRPMARSAMRTSHNYATRGQDRYVLESARQQLDSRGRSSSPATGIKRKKKNTPKSLDPDDEEAASMAKIEEQSPSMGFSFTVQASRSSAHVRDDEEERGRYFMAPASTSPRTGQEFPRSRDGRSYPDDDADELVVHGYKSRDGQWHLAAPSRNGSSSSTTVDPMPHGQGIYDHAPSGFAHPMAAAAYYERPHWQDHNFRQQQQPWDHGSYHQMDYRPTYSGLYPVQQQPMPYYQPLYQDDMQPLQYQGATANEYPAHYHAAWASSSMSTPMQDLQGFYGQQSSDHGYFHPSVSSTPATISNIDDGMNDLNASLSDVGHSPMEHAGPIASPSSSGTLSSRFSSLSSSLTLSPVVRKQDTVDPGREVAIGSEDTHYAPLGPHAPSDDKSSSNNSASGDYQHQTTSDHSTAQAQQSTAAMIGTPQPQPLSMSFMHTTANPSFYSPRSVSTPIPMTMSAMAMGVPMPVPVHMPPVGPILSASFVHGSASQCHPSLQCQQIGQVHSQQHRRPSILAMTFSSAMHMRPQVVYSPVGSTVVTPQAEIAKYYPGAAESNGPAVIPMAGGGGLAVSEGMIAEATREESGGGDGAEPSSPKSQLQSAQSNTIGGDEGEQVVEAEAHGQSSPESMAGQPSDELSSMPTATSTPIHVQGSALAVDVGAQTPQHLPQSTGSAQQPPTRQHFMSPSSFLFQDPDERYELNRLENLLKVHPDDDESQLAIDEGQPAVSDTQKGAVITDLTEHHQRQEIDDQEGDEDEEADEDDGESSVGVQETGGYDDEISGNFEHDAQGLHTPALPASPTGGDSHPSGGGSQLLSPVTLLAMQHLSHGGSQMDASVGSGGTMPSSGSLGQDEYLFHQARPTITKRHIQQYGAGLGSSDTYGGYASSGLGSGGSGGQHGRASDDMPWALARHEASSEFAVQLFSGLDVSRGRVCTSDLGVGIGTNIGKSSGGHGHYYVEMRSDTPQFSDPADQFQFDDDLARYQFTSPHEQQQLQKEGDESEQSLQHQHRDASGRGDSIRTTVIDSDGVLKVEIPEDRAAGELPQVLYADQMARHGQKGWEVEADELEALGLYSPRHSSRSLGSEMDYSDGDRASPAQVYSDDRDNDGHDEDVYSELDLEEQTHDVIETGEYVDGQEGDDGYTGYGEGDEGYGDGDEGYAEVEGMAGSSDGSPHSQGSAASEGGSLSPEVESL